LVGDWDFRRDLRRFTYGEQKYKFRGKAKAGLLRVTESSTKQCFTQLVGRGSGVCCDTKASREETSPEPSSTR